MMLLALPFVSNGDDVPTSAKPAVYGVLFYADWCGSCKALDPKITRAREEAKLDEQDVLFVRLDLTDDTTKHQAAMMAAVMGISDLYESNSGKTGFMLLIDAESGEKLAQLTQKLEVGDIASKIQSSVKTAKS
jgi:thiol-disulfide isomerase/thioredoxin